MKTLLIALAGLVLLVVVGGVLLVRSLLSPESIRSTLETQLSEALGEPVTIGGASLSMWPTAGIALTDVTIGAPVAVTLRRTAVNTDMRPLLSRRIENAEIIVEDGTVDLAALMNTLDRLGSPAAAPASDPAIGQDAVTLVNIKTIAFRNVTVAAAGHKTTMSFESSLTGDRLDISELTATSDLTTLSATGAIESLKDRKATLALTADPLDLDGLMVFAEALGQTVPAGAGDPSVPAVPGQIDLTLDLAARKGLAAGVSFTGLTARAHVTGDGVVLEPFTFGMFGGRLDGAVHVDTRPADPVVTVTGKMSDLDMDQVMEFAGNKGAMTGRLGGTLAVSGAGADPQKAMARATGKGAIAITDGRVRGLQLVRAVVLAFGKPDAMQPVQGGEAFSKFDATYALADGIVTFSDLSFLSRDVALSGSGEVRLAESTVDITGTAMLSEELTSQAGRDLVRYMAENGKVTLPATVTGTVSDPRVGIDVGNLARRAVTNEVDRQMKKQGESLLKGLLKRKKPPQ